LLPRPRDRVVWLILSAVPLLVVARSFRWPSACLRHCLACAHWPDPRAPAFCECVWLVTYCGMA
jgi:hypothetical protein